jgi:hypothetical protein
LFLRSPETIQIQAIQLKNAVEIPSSGSARVKEEEIAIIEIAVANKNGRNFFMPVNIRCPFKQIQKSNQVNAEKIYPYQYFFFLTFLLKKSGF